jgi:hypothetical protein
MCLLSLRLFVQEEVFFCIQMTSTERGELSTVIDGRRCNLCWALMMRRIYWLQYASCGTGSR